MRRKPFLVGWRRSRSERPRPRRATVHLQVIRLESRWLLSGPGIVEYPATSSASQPLSAVAGGDGNLWVTEYAAKEVVALSSTGTILKSITVSGNPYGITAASDGTLWVTENGTTPYIGHLSTAGGGSVLAQYRAGRGDKSRGNHGGSGRQHLVRGIRHERGG